MPAKLYMVIGRMTIAKLMKKKILYVNDLRGNEKFKQWWYVSLKVMYT